jgi:hypothetical protein
VTFGHGPRPTAPRRQKCSKATIASPSFNFKRRLPSGASPGPRFPGINQRLYFGVIFQTDPLPKADGTGLRALGPDAMPDGLRGVFPTGPPASPSASECARLASAKVRKAGKGPVLISRTFAISVEQCF